MAKKSNKKRPAGQGRAKKKRYSKGTTNLPKSPSADVSEQISYPPPSISHGNGRPADKQRDEQAMCLVEAIKECGLVFATPDGEPFVTVPIYHDGNMVRSDTYRLESRNFDEWIRHYWYTQKTSILSDQTLKNLKSILAAEAKYSAQPRCRVFCRIGSDDKALWLDLANDAGECVRIDSRGWMVTNSPGVKFIRAANQLPLSAPVRGGSLQQLRKLLNVSDEQWPLIVAWLLAAFRPSFPFTILMLHGEHGGAKSTTAKVLRSQIDPAKAMLRGAPCSEQDLMISAQNSWVLAMDNLSCIKADLSDWLCRISTGGGFSTRKLYENSDEFVMDAMRPVIITGIDYLATRGDLLSRCLVLTLPQIDKSNRRTEEEIMAECAELQPHILGALLDAVACGLKNLPTFKDDVSSRMADFEKFVVSAEQKLPWRKGTFAREYAANQNEAHEVALESSPVATLAITLSENGWDGTATEYLNYLRKESDTKGIPKSPRTLSSELRRAAPNLRAIGVDVQFDRLPGRKRERIISIRRVD